MGCFLLYTGNDFQQTEVFERPADLHDYIDRHTEIIADAIANPDHPNHKVVMSFILRNIDCKHGEPNFRPIPENYKALLPDAICRIARINRDVLGLVKPAQNWSSHKTSALAEPSKLGHKTRGDAFAAELIIAAALTQQSWVPGNLSNTKDNRLFCRSTDRIDLGVKLERDPHAEGFGRLDHDRRVARFVKPHREQMQGFNRFRVEADVFIQRSEPKHSDYKLIGVDVKHSASKSEYKLKTTTHYDDFVSQLGAVEQAIQHGVITEFRFVTNGFFSDTIKELITKTNDRMAASEAKQMAEDRELAGKHPTAAELKSYEESFKPKIIWHSDVWMET